MSSSQDESGFAAVVRPLQGDGRGWVLVLVAFGWFLTLGMRYFVPAILPQIKTTFGIDNTTAGVVVTVIWVTYALMQFPSGSLIGHFGERRLLVTSLAAAGVSLVVLALSPTFIAFLAGCAVFGLGTGVFGPPRGTLLSRTFPDNDGAAFGLTLAAGSIGSAILPLIAGFVTGSIGWRYSVVLAVPGFLVAAVGTWVVVSDRSDGVGRSDDDDVPTGSTLRAIRDAIFRRSVAIPIVAVTFLLFVLEGLTAFLPTYLVETRHIGQGLAAGIFASFFVVGAVSQFAAGNLADRYGDRPILLSVTLLSAIPLVAIPYVSGVVPLAALVAFAGIRQAINSLNNAYVIAVLPDATQGMAWGLLRTCFFMLGSTGSIFVGRLADHRQYRTAFFLLACLTILGAVLYVFLPNRRSD